MRELSFEEFMRLTPEERAADAQRSMWNAVERAIKVIAQARRNAELAHGVSNQEFDQKLNELCEKANNRYCNMTKEQLALDMLISLATETSPDDLRRMMEE